MKSSKRAGASSRPSSSARKRSGAEDGQAPSGVAGNSRVWTRREEEFIRRNYQRLGSAGVAESLGRTASAVVDRAKRLGVRSLRVRPWTAAELQYLEKNYPRRTAEQIARTLGRSLQSIRGQIHLSGLGAEPPARWSERELAYLRRTYGRSTIAEIARDLGRTPAAVQLKGGKLGLQRKVRQPGKRDVAWVIANLGRLSMEAMSRRLGISVNAVQRIARQKGYAPKSHLRRWSQTEDEFIRRNYATMTCRELGQALGRSLDMVSWRTRRLGLTDGEHRKQVRWRPAEEKILIASFGRCDREEIARKLGRTVRAVESRIERLKRLGKIR